MPPKLSIKRCQQCVAEAAIGLLERAHEVRIFIRHTEPPQSPSRYLFADKAYDTTHDRKSASRGRGRTRRPGQDSQHGRSLRTQSLPTRVISHDEMSAIELPRLQRPEPNMDLLPPLSMKQFHRYASDTKPGRFPRNMSSRTALITADSVPQFEWTRADCCDWISKFLQGNFNIPEHLAQHKASMSQENGEGLYHTSLWHWRDRCGCVVGEMIYYHLYQCRDMEMVRSLDPANFDFRRYNVPPGYKWEDYDS